MFQPRALDVRTFPDDYKQMIVLAHHLEWTLCPHHLLPVELDVSLAYIPNGAVLGVSKLARVVDCFARRLQVQERLTNQIADFIYDNLKPQGVTVVLEAAHSCITIRGAKKPGSIMVTSALRGVFRKDPRSRGEVMSLIHNGKR